MSIMKKCMALLMPMLMLGLFVVTNSNVQAKQSNTITILNKDLGVKEIISVKFTEDEKQLKEEGFTITSTKDKFTITSSNNTAKPFEAYENSSLITVLAKDYFGHTHDFSIYVNINKDNQSFEITPGDFNYVVEDISIKPATLLMNKFLAVKEIRYDGKKMTVPNNGLDNVQLIYNNLTLLIEIKNRQANTKIYEIDVVGLRNGQEVTETLRFYYNMFRLPVIDIEGERLREELHVDSSTPKYIITPDLTVMIDNIHQVVDENLFYYFTIDKGAAIRGYGFMGGVTLKDLQQFFQQDGSMDALWGIDEGADILAVRKKDLALMAVNQINGKGQLNPEIKRYAPYVVTLPANIKKWTTINTGESYVIEKIEGRKLYIRPTDDYGLISNTKNESSALMSFSRNSSSLGFYKLKNYNGKIYLQGAY